MGDIDDYGVGGMAEQNSLHFRAVRIFPPDVGREGDQRSPGRAPGGARAVVQHGASIRVVALTVNRSRVRLLNSG